MSQIFGPELFHLPFATVLWSNLLRYGSPSGRGLILRAVAAPDSEHRGEKKLRHDWSEYRGAQHQHEN